MNKILTNLFWKFGERISSQLVTFIVSIVLGRLLSPDVYGEIALVTVFITIAEVFAISGFGNALIQKKDADNVDFSSVLYFNFIFSIALYLIIYFFAPYIADFYGIDSLIPVLRVLSLRIPIASINSVQQAYVSKNMMFKKFFYSTLFGTLFSGIVGIVMAYSGYGIWALVGQYLFNTIVNTIVLWFIVDWRPKLVFSWKRLTALISYGWKLLVSSLLDNGYNQLTSLVIGKKYSSSDLAFYNRGQQYPQLVIVNINSSISSVLFPAIAQNQDNLSVVKSMTKRAIKTSSYIMWPLMIGLIIVSKPLISFMLTDKWLPCVPYLQIACFTYAFWPIHTANLEALKAIGRSDIFLKLEIIKKTVGILLLMFSMNYGVMVIAVSQIISTFISCFINAYPNQKLLNYKYIDQMKDMIPGFFLACIMGGIISPISLVIKNNVLLIIVQVFSGGIIYLLLSKVFNLESFTYLINTIRRQRN